MANNLRLIYDNIVSSATVTSTAAQAEYPVSNIQNKSKSRVFRSTSLNFNITFTWSSQKPISSVILPHTNLTNNAIIRVYIYTNSTDASASAIIGPVSASPFSYKTLSETGGYSFGGGSCARVWFDQTYTCAKIMLQIADTTNVDGYVELATAVVGDYWSPTYNTSFGIQAGYLDASEQLRTEAGELHTLTKYIYKTLSLELQWLPPQDRTKFIDIVKTTGLKHPVFVSVFPNDSDIEKESLYQIYGNFTEQMLLTHPIFTKYVSNITIQEI